MTSEIEPALTQDLVPTIGIFWRVPHEGALVLVTDSVPFTEAEVYGDCITHPRGHYEVWEEWRKLGSRELKRRGLPLAIISHDYEHFPRGRIVYDLKTKYFTIYTDRKLETPYLVDQILKLFHLERKQYKVRPDSHYKTSNP